MKEIYPMMNFNPDAPMANPGNGPDVTEMLSELETHALAQGRQLKSPIDPNMVTHNSEGSKTLSSQLTKTIDEATAHIVSELDDLSHQIEKMKNRVMANSESAKRAVAGHFVLAAEASIFAASIHTKLTTCLHEAETMAD